MQTLKVRAKLTAGIDYLWAIQVAEPINEKHLTKDPKPVAGAKAGEPTRADRLLKKIDVKG